MHSFQLHTISQPEAISLCERGALTCQTATKKTCEDRENSVIFAHFFSHKLGFSGTPDTVRWKA